MRDGFDQDGVEDEVERRWGQTDAYREATRRTKAYTKSDWQRIRVSEDAILERLVDRLEAGEAPSDPKVVELAEQHRLHIDRWFYPCTREMHVGLAELYLVDRRFRAAFEERAAGLTQFLADAIRANA